MDEFKQPIAPVPASPEGVEGIPVAQPAAEMPQEQMRANLEGLMSKIEGKYQDFNSQKFTSENKIKEHRSVALSAIFDLLEQNGVDPSNVEQVGAFLSQIKETNPELSKKIEDSMNDLLGKEEGEVAEGEPVEPVIQGGAEGEMLQ